MVRSVAVLLLASVAGAQNLFYDSYTTTSTGLVEEYYVAYPTGEPPGGLVVAFHGTGFSPAGTYQEIVELNNDGDPDTDWDFLARATAPPYGFYVLMLDGGWDHNQATHHTFGREAFQDTAQETIERVCSQYPIDTNRIFGMGFSMGGGEVMSFAARHLNPNKPGMFAAIINHTGGVSVPYTYNYVSAPAGREYLEDLYGLTPGDTYCDDPLPFQRASVIDVADCCNSGQSCPAQGQVAYETSIAHNVSHVPILRYYSPNDSSASLVYQTEMLDEFMQTTQHFNYIEQTTQPNGNGIYHAWNVIPSGQALPFFNLYSLQIPTTATTLATEDTRYFHFRVKRDDVDALAPFTWRWTRPATRSTCGTSTT